MPTAQQRLRKWYRSESLWKRASAVVIKTVLEGGLAAGIAAGATAIYWMLLQSGVFFETVSWSYASVFATTLAGIFAAVYCFTTVESS
mgnify:CR=1 FL=1